ncbi:hypothetical protein FOA52_013884 [Chlamydomonas sp. UWO 241]|nr:hypothetical protein FOA52_013884 [Chlamydomonas sp. UWO 241]
MEVLVGRADRAFVEEDFDEAVLLYTQALSSAPSNASAIYESRAHAHIKAGAFLDAANDASKAIELDPSNTKAYLRRGIALFSLDEFEAAKAAFEDVQRLDPGNAQCKKWIRKCQAELDEESGGAEAAAAPAAAEPAGPTPAPAPAAAAGTSAAASASVAPAALPEVVGKYRHQYYQLQNRVMVDVYAKNKRREDVIVEFTDSHLCITIADESGAAEEEYKLDVDLYGKVDPTACKFEVLRTKIEITMTKADNVQWGSLEKSAKIAAPNYSTPGTTAPAKYPSSGKAPKDWDKLDSELNELESKGELDDGDPLNSFFKKIFSGGDEDTRRAMMKSFVESNGTVLSTNWTDVGNKKVECTPPDGMEAKRWEGSS